MSAAPCRTLAAARPKLSPNPQQQHPHVVAILNFHETWSHAHIVMELLPGGDLYTQVIQRYWNAERDGYAEREVREI